MPGREDLGKPLISLTTDLKSLKYTLVSETTGKTSGKDPYVTKSIDGKDSLPSSQITARTDDLKRFTKFGLDKPGQKFATNQAILGVHPVQIAATAASLLAQVPVNGTGTHFINGFIKDTYLQKDIGQGTALGRFLVDNLGINNLNGAGRALQGKTIIQDNEGQEFFRPNAEDKLQDRNSKFDLKPGSDENDFITPLINQYLRSDIVAIGEAVAFTVKGLISKNKADQQQGKKKDLSNIFKSSPLNLGQEGYRTEKEEDTFDHESIQSELKGPESPDKFVQSGTEDVEGRPIIKGTPEGENAKIISDNDGGRGFTPNSPSFLENKESSTSINVEGEEKPLKPEINVEEDSYLKKGGLESGRRVVATNRGQDGFNSDQYAQYSQNNRLDREEEARSDLNDTSIVNTYYRSANITDVRFDQDDAASAGGAGRAQEGNVDGRNIVKGTPDGENAKIIRDNQLTNGQAFNDDFVQAKGYFSARDQEVVTDGPSINPNISKETVENPPSAGRIIGSLGTEYDTATEGFVTRTEDEDGNPLIVQGENVDPGTVPTTNLKYFQDDYEEYGLDFDSGQITGADGKGGRVTKLIDFRRIRKDSKLTNIPGGIQQGENGYDSKSDISPIDYTTQDIEVRLGMAKGRQKFTDEVQADYINSLGITANDTVISNTTDRPDPEYLTKDIIPFEIVSLTPESSTFLYFRAFLDDFSDDFTGNWSGEKFIGRGEEFYTYQGFKRDISFSFKIAAFTSSELIPLYRKLNFLAGTTAPTYNSEGSFMRGTLTEITIGDYLYRQEGFISKVGLSWNNSYAWEIDLYEQNLPKVPTVLEVSVSFTPIHKFNPTSIPNLINGEGLYMGYNLSQ